MVAILSVKRIDSAECKCSRVIEIISKVCKILGERANGIDQVCAWALCRREREQAYQMQGVAKRAEDKGGGISSREPLASGFWQVQGVAKRAEDKGWGEISSGEPLASGFWQVEIRRKHRLAK